MAEHNKLFDAREEVERLRAVTRTRRKTTYRRSRLDRFTGELLQLRQAGASIAELQRWLRERRIIVVHATVARWLNRQSVGESSIGQIR